MGTRFYLYSLMLLCLGGYLLAEWKGISFSSFNVATDAKIRQALARVDSLQKDRVRYIQIHNQELEKRQQLQGMTLQERLRRVMPVMRQLVQGLAYLHRVRFIAPLPLLAPSRLSCMLLPPFPVSTADGCPAP